MVGMEIIAEMDEGREMVKRDPTMKDVFPSLKRWEGIATDEDRQRYGIKSHARLNIPTCLPIDEMAAWAEKLYTLVQDIKVACADENKTEIEKLFRIQLEVGALNRQTLKQISENRNRYYERKGKEK